MITLVTPDAVYEGPYRDMIAAWETAMEEPEPWVLREDAEDFPAMVSLLQDYARGRGLLPGFFASHTFWARDEATGQLVGAVNIRPELNAYQSVYGGNIGYGVRPDRRRMGFATEILGQALCKAREIGMREVLLCCYRENRASERVILKNGGIFEDEVKHEETGHVIKRFRISLTETGKS